MDVEIDYNRNEFFGEIGRYCTDKDDIWFYDEISGGLYRLDRKSYIVETILTPMEIHEKEKFSILQILKWESDIYLIPNNISYKWLVYNIVDKSLKSVRISSQSYEIGNSVIIGKAIYLIPEKINHVLAIVEVGTLKLKMIVANWYKINTGRMEGWCWGYSKFEDTILFPVIGTSEIFQIQGEQIEQLPLYIRQPIYSISLCKNSIWILPCNGKIIFCIDKNSGCVDSVEIRTSCYEDTADRYARIIAVDRYVYLFPKQGGRILVLETDSKEWIAIGKKDEPLYRSLYQKTKSVPYWGCYCNEEKLYILPLQYRFAEISTKDRTISYKFLQCASTIMNQQYLLYVRWMNKENNFIEWEKNSLKDFWRNILTYDTVYNGKFIGKNIWTMLGKL